jgi:parallel beta-helix repeat protein
MKRVSVSLFFFLAFAIFFFPQSTYALKTLTGTISTNTVLDTVGGRIYHVTGNVTVNNGVTLTIEPGVCLKFDIGRYITIEGKIEAVGGGTADSLIVFTSIRDDNAPPPSGDDTNGDGNATVPNNGDWYYVWFRDNSDDSSMLKHCDVRYGGRGSSANILLDDASPTFEDCDISAGYYGIQCNGQSDPIIKSTSINAMTDVPVALQITANPQFDDVAFASTSDNGFDAIGILGGTLTGPNLLNIRSATLGVTPIDNLVYILLSDVTIAGGGDLTIQPGVVVKPKGNVDVIVNGTLTMDGTSDPDSAIVFTSFKDDNFGDPADTNNDGSTTSPAVGDWGQIVFLSGSSGSVTYAVIKFGGYSDEGVVRVVDESPPVENCEISDVYFGIEQGGLAASNIQDNSISNTTYTPILMSVTADPTFSGNTFSNVGLTALGIIGETIAIDAVLKVRTVAGYDNITYWLENTLTMALGADLRVEPGVVVKVRYYYYSIIVEGSLRADATSDSIIAFTSQYDDAVGNPADTEGNGSATTPDDENWAYIKFAATSDDAKCILDHCLISYGGADPSVNYRGAVWCNSSSPTITNCDFRTNGTGIRTDGSAAPLIQDNDFYNNIEIPLATSVLANPDYVDNTFDQNTYHAVGILAETLSQDAVLERIFVGGPPQFSEYFPYLHLGKLTVGSGAVLTVEPGVVVKVLSGGTPLVVDGGLAMAGAPDPDSMIVYTSIKDDSYAGDSNVDGSSTSPSAGDWRYIDFNATTIDTASVLEECLFRFGGSSEGVVRMFSASPAVHDCQFEINHWGLWIQNASNPTVEDNLFRLTTYAPISKSVLAEPTFSGNVYDNNGYDCLGLIGEAIAQDLTVKKWDVAGYTNIARTLVKTTLDVNFGATLTIEPGVVLKMGEAYGGPFAARIAVDGAITAQGTEMNPIVFTSILDDEHGNPLDTNNDGSLSLPDQSDWREIQFHDVSNDTSNVFEWCLFRYGGYGGTSVQIQTASPKFDNCTFEDNNNYGIRIEGASNPIIQNCTFAEHDVTPIVMSLVSDPTLSDNVFLASNGYSALGIIGETLAQDVTWRRREAAGVSNIPYILTNNLTAGLSSILRIEPGVVIKPLTGISITVKRGLIAEGKDYADSLIVFTSPRDDFYGGDTNNDSTDTDGSSLRWGRVQIDNEAIDDSTRFSNCVFRFATNSSSYGALYVVNANPSVENTIFTQNGNGVNYIGAAGDSLKGKIERCDIFENTYYGVKNTGMSFVVSAKNCWWGDASGPYDPSDDTPGGFYNPGGLGDPVTDMVDYSGWQTGGIENLLLGDVSLNGEVRAYDSSLILQHLALLITLTSQQQVIGDVTCSGGLSTLDASYILRFVAGLLSYFPCAIDSLSPVSPYLASAREPEYYPGMTPGDFSVEIPSFNVEPGAVAVVPIEVSGTGEILGHEYRIAFDPRQLTVVDVRLTDAAKDAMLQWNVVDAGAGRELAIALASAELLPVEGAVVVEVRASTELESGADIPFDFSYVRLNEQELTESAVSAGGRAGVGNLPTQYGLGQNSPNPFNPTTVISYDVPAAAGTGVHVLLNVYDVAGRLVRTLVDRSDVPGAYKVVWDGTDNRGQAVGTGVYFYRIEAGSFRATKKMLLLK